MFGLKLKSMRTDNDALMLNIGIGMVLGYALMAAATISFWFYRMDWFQDGFMGTLWSFAPFVFALGAMIIASRLTMDPKIIIAAGILSAVFYWVFFVMG